MQRTKVKSCKIQKHDSPRLIIVYCCCLSFDDRSRYVRHSTFFLPMITVKKFWFQNEKNIDVIINYAVWETYRRIKQLTLHSWNQVKNGALLPKKVCIFTVSSKRTRRFPKRHPAIITGSTMAGCHLDMCRRIDFLRATSYSLAG